MEFRFNKETKVSLPDGVDANKFGALLAVAVTPEEVKKVFIDHNYNLDTVPGGFLKAFCMNAMELREVENNLGKIEKMGMHSIFQTNLKLKYFRNSFMSRLEKCMAAGLPYLNSDNTFASFFDNEEEFNEYLASTKDKDMKIPNNITQTDLITGQIEYEANQQYTEMSNQEMTPEDKQVYNEIVERLNYLVLGNPLDTMLASVVKNAINNVVDAILRHEYQFVGVREMVKSVMFNNIEVAQEDKMRIEDLVLGAFPNEERTVG